MGFYGVDQVGEMLEDPFGTDFNALPLDEMGIGLATDLDLTLEVSRQSQAMRQKRTLASRALAASSISDFDKVSILQQQERSVGKARRKSRFSLSGSIGHL